MIYLAFDPSIRCTGYAAIRTHREYPHGVLLEMGRIRPDGEDALSRCCSLRKQVVEVGRRVIMYDDACIIVETPFHATGRKPGAVRSAVTLPAYGMAVASVLIAVDDVNRLREVHDILLPRAGEWSRGLPGTTNDKKKKGRVNLAAAIYGVQPSEFGPADTAGDVADALLMANWALSLAEVRS